VPLLLQKLSFVLPVHGVISQNAPEYPASQSSQAHVAASAVSWSSPTTTVLPRPWHRPLLVRPVQGVTSQKVLLLELVNPSKHLHRQLPALEILGTPPLLQNVSRVLPLHTDISQCVPLNPVLQLLQMHCAPWMSGSPASLQWLVEVLPSQGVISHWSPL